jgi:hypothetical protein
MGGGALAGQGLERAEKWVSIGGVLASAMISAVGLWLGWLTWRHNVNTPASAPPVTAGGTGAVAIGGSSGGQVVTEVSGVVSPPAPQPAAGGGVTAAGAGAVAVGRDSTAPIQTRVTGAGGARP